MPQNNDQNQTPAAFSGWDKLFVRSSDPKDMPPGWTNMAADSAGKPVKIADAARTISDAAKSAIGDAVRTISDAGWHVYAAMTAPDGKEGFIPVHRASEAEKAGFTHGHAEHKNAK